jgi:hypothetical protein
MASSKEGDDPMPCTTLATHRWRTLNRVALSLPDDTGYFEVHVIWQCRDCDATREATGFLHRTTVLVDPVQWNVQAQRQHTRQDALARAFQVHAAQERQAQYVQAHLVEEAR